MTVAAPHRMPMTMRRVNDLIWESLDNGGHAEPVAFFCECEREGCYRPVWLTPTQYEQSRAEPDWYAFSPAHGEAAAR